MLNTTSEFLGLSLHDTLCNLSFIAPDYVGDSYLVLRNGNRLVFNDVNGGNKRVNLYTSNYVQIWHVAVHRLPLSIIQAILVQAIADNKS